MIHDQTASVLALARNVLSGVDRSKIETSVQTATLILLIETLIDIGTPSAHTKMAAQAGRTVLGHMTAVGGVDGRQP